MKNSFDRLSFEVGAGQLWMLAPQQRFDQLAVTHLTVDQWNPKHLPNDLGVAINEVVEHDRLVTGEAEGTHGMAADISSTTGDENSHSRTS
jgi:hypothetical protein